LKLAHLQQFMIVFLFLDGRSCWVIGQSIKDAAKSKPTYLAPLDAPTTDLKSSEYEKIWNSAKTL